MFYKGSYIYISIEQQCPKTGGLQAATLKLSLGPKQFVDISSGLSQNWSFCLNLIDKGRTILQMSFRILTRQEVRKLYLCEKLMEKEG